MKDNTQIDAILAAVEDHGLLRSIHRIDDRTCEGEAVVEGRRAILRLDLGPSFPLALPRILLRPWDALGFIPHVDANGVVCFADEEGLILDRRRPGHIATEAIERAIAVLSDGVSGRNRADFADEFEAYWERLVDGVAVISVLDPPDDLREIIIAIGDNKALYVAADTNDITAYNNGTATDGPLTYQKALYLPLTPGTLIVPPRFDRPCWSADEARHALVSGLSDVNKANLRRLTKRRTRWREYVIVRLPRPSGGESLFGIRYDEVGKTHPLLEGGTAKQLIPLRLRRHDRAYLVRRGGGDVDLGEMRVLLAGCGAVGGHLAIELARAGVSDLTLVDPDVLTPENTFRHALGRSHWHRHKVDALKAAIDEQLPYVRITAHAIPIEQALADGTIDLGEYDLVVLALGNPTVELEVNTLLHASEGHPPALFTWLEPLGIGGHTLLTTNAGDSGCFECLYTAPGGARALDNRASFAAPGQSFGRALSGCGTTHTPYGSVDAVRTAALAARLAIDALTGKERRGTLLSWKGDAAAFEAMGFRLSDRYRATDDELCGHRHTFKSPRCQICGGRDGGREQ